MQRVIQITKKKELQFKNIEKTLNIFPPQQKLNKNKINIVYKFIKIIYRVTLNHNTCVEEEKEIKEL